LEVYRKWILPSITKVMDALQQCSEYLLFSQ
jgi:hypothetical protein